MAVIEGGISGSLMGVGAQASSAGHVQIRPFDAGSLGHYTLSVRVNSTTAQAANARVFELRNTGTNLIVLTELRLRALQTAAGTAQENSLDAFKVTGFTAVDTTNTLTPTSSVRRTSGMAAFPGGAAVRYLNPAAAGMTGGTLTKDGNSFATLPYNVSTAIATASQWGPLECCPPQTGVYPFAFAQNEGFILENRVLNVTSYGITWFIDCSWAEVAAF